jgi:Tol biopolymer transport system component
MLALALFSAAPLFAQSTARVSVGALGTQANSNSFSPSLSGDAQSIAFYSEADDLVNGDSNSLSDVFVRDLRTNSTTLVSVSSSGVQGDGASTDARISARGRFVAFTSFSTNLVFGDTNGMYDVFVRDLLLSTTVRVSVDSLGAQGDGYSSNPSISANGRFVAFGGGASNLVAGDTNGVADIFVHDLLTGITTRASVASSDVQGDRSSQSPSISGDGRYVAFESSATNLVPGDTNGLVDVFVRDMLARRTGRVNVAWNGAQANSGAGYPFISADGRRVSFASYATNLVHTPVTNNALDIFVRDLSVGNTELVSVSSTGVLANAGSTKSAISADGRFVAFKCDASNLVSGDTNSASDIFLRDTRLGTTECVSVGAGQVQANSISSAPAISADGSSVGFYSFASNLVLGDTNGAWDVFVRQL